MALNPHQKNKVDVSSLSPEEQKLFRLYGKLPNTKDLLANKLKERKYFDSGDYALSKAGKASDTGVTQVGREHPNPENIPHSSSPHASTINGHVLSPPTGGADAMGRSGSISGATGGGGFGGFGIANGSPVKEGSYLHRETSVSDLDDGAGDVGLESERGSEHASKGPVPIMK